MQLLKIDILDVCVIIGVIGIWTMAGIYILYKAAIACSDEKRLYDESDVSEEIGAVKDAIAKTSKH